MELRIHRFIPSTKVEGPGTRACLQVQGCPIHCSGCAVPFTWPEDGGYVMKIDELAAQILDGPEVEGITFLGGEPFAQARELAKLGSILKEAGLSVMTFTGYLIEDLQASGNPDYLHLLDVTDLLVDGPFQREHLDTTRPWVGSSNQRYHFLSDRYLHLRDRLMDIPNRLEVRLSPNGSIHVNGLARVEDLEELFGNLI
ncbi:ribonucleoside-triphosphate reductase activating protein [Paenibacillus elgii]|uniref:Anaerobic ribonucleoside-triphosphate reductase-activating protein n=1 Tax=Paenibacillus elgii TaxID=189691 RepID=A0A2T6G8X5_9BACL|nr:4Fe-4S single cluster domain-containing protein [Paenibacillus elgii]PUA40590.1 ribonucleoside-triphosphate reductase activating protein [Paenibacillus elgii]